MLDLENGGLEYCGLACKLFCVVFGGEGNVYVKVFTNLVANDFFFKAGDEVAGTKLEGIIFALAAFKCNAVNKAFIVDVTNITHNGCRVGNFNFARVALTNHIDFVFDFFIGNFSNGLFSLNTKVISDLHVGLNSNNCRKNNTVIINRNDIELGLANHVQFRFLQCFVKSIGKNLIDSILIEESLAVHFFNYGTGSLALAEAGNCDFADLLTVNVGYCLIKGSFVYRELQFIGALFGFCGFDQTHFQMSSKGLW